MHNEAGSVVEIQGCALGNGEACVLVHDQTVVDEIGECGVQRAVFLHHLGSQHLGLLSVGFEHHLLFLAICECEDDGIGHFGRFHQGIFPYVHLHKHEDAVLLLNLHTINRRAELAVHVHSEPRRAARLQAHILDL